MKYRVEKKEDVAAALLRLVRDDLDQVEASLSGGGRREERIHTARQRLKRMRTLLRVLERPFGDRAVAARRALARAARLLARVRDADVAAASARVLAASTANSDVGFGRIADVLDREAERAHAERTPFGDVARELSHARAEITTFDDDFDGAVLLQKALNETYRAGRRAMRRGEQTLATPDLHAWRKAVKSLWHILRLSRKRLPRRLQHHAVGLAELGELLGLDHDHAALAEKLALSPEADLALMHQLAVIAERRRSLEMEAFALGRRLYRRKAKAFARKAAIS